MPSPPPDTADPRGSSSPADLRVCPGCGRIAPTRREQCAVCGGDLAGALVIPPRDDGAYAVAVRCEFQCRQCGKLAPLNGLDLDGSVVCAHCSLDQAYDVGAWKEGLRHAQGVGDLAGPTPEGRHPHPRFSIVGANPAAEVGVTLTSVTSTQASTRLDDGVLRTRSLRLEASPGHPLCPACRVPLEVTLREDASTTRCPRCGDAATYDTPAAARELHDSLWGVMAEDHRRDHQDVRIDLRAGGDTVALACPGCGAALPGHGESKVVVCAFCQTVSRIPDRVLQQTFHVSPQKETWWLWFRGPSRLRRRVENLEPIEGWKGADRPTPQAIEKAPTVPTSPVPRWIVALLLTGLALGLTLAVIAATGLAEDIARAFLMVEP